MKLTGMSILCIMIKRENSDGRKAEDMKKLMIKNRVFGEGKPLLCVPVMEHDRGGIIREITYLTQSEADMIEWRVDVFDDFLNYNAIRDILEQVKPLLDKKIFLYTFRTKRQGGEGEISEEELEDLHDLAAESGCVDLIDLEFFAETHTAGKIAKLQAQGAHVIASHHDFEETPTREVMQMLLEKMCAGGADIVKLAVMPKNRKDVLNLLEVTGKFQEENADTPIITMSMGKLGSVSRLCGEQFGSCVTFGAHQKTSAPGQFDMKKLAETLDMIHGRD